MLQGCAQHDGRLDPDALLTREYWDARYGSAEQIWSGNSNPQLVAQVAGLVPGSVLDVGCGEGADAIWLAERGWQVTAIDISPVALERAAKRAREAGHEVAQRISWQQADVLTWDPAPRQFDLVSAQFMHLPRPARVALHRRLAAAVRPGGSLLIVGHHPADLETTVGRPHLPDFLYTPEDVAATLDAAEWNVTAATAPGRQARDPEGRSVTIRDAVVRAFRRTPATVASSDS
jgi:SAM-dependent methyltransferase